MNDEAATPPQPSAGLRAALLKWLFPRGFDHPGHWSLTNEGATAIARAALAAKPDAEPQPVRERVDAPWNGHRAIETLRRMHAEESPALLVWECVPANIAADIVAAKPDAGTERDG